MIEGSNDETYFPHKLVLTDTKLLLTDTQVSKIRKVFAIGFSANIKISKTQLSKIVKLGGFLFSSSDISDIPMALIK